MNPTQRHVDFRLEIQYDEVRPEGFFGRQVRRTMSMTVFLGGSEIGLPFSNIKVEGCSSTVWVTLPFPEGSMVGILRDYQLTTEAPVLIPDGISSRRRITGRLALDYPLSLVPSGDPPPLALTGPKEPLYGDC